MITHVLRLTMAEWYKMRRRWMTWVLLGIVLVITQGVVWGSYALYHVGDAVSGDTLAYSKDTVSFELTCADLLVDGRVEEQISLLSGDERSTVGKEVQEFGQACDEYVLQREESRDSFTLPASINGSVGIFAAYGIILLVVLAASCMGVEYGWGTLRTALTRGTGRWQLLSAKLIAIMLMGAAGLLVISMLTAVASLIAGVVPPGEGGPLPGSEAGTWLAAAAEFGKVVYALAPYVVLAVFMTALTQSANQGTTVALAFLIAESFILPPILGLTDWLEKVKLALLSENVGVWVDTETLADTLRGFFVILAYIVVLSAAAFWLFQRRDVSGPRGE